MTQPSPFQLRRVRPGCIGVTVGDTEHVLSIAEALSLGRNLTQAATARSSKPERRQLTSMQRVDGAATREKLAGKMVRIWSGEHNAWWCENRSGYCTDIVGAGIYAFEAAWHATNHCGPEKKIVFEVVE